MCHSVTEKQAGTASVPPSLPLLPAEIRFSPAVIQAQVFV